MPLARLYRFALAAPVVWLTALAASPRGQPPASVELLTVTASGIAGGGEVFDGFMLYGTGRTNISADNRYVVFSSASPQLVAGDTNGVQDVFVRDRQTGITTLVSLASGAAQSNGPSGQPVISADGRFVAFVSVATNLVPGDTNQSIDPGLGTPVPASGYDVFVRDLQAQTTVRASVSSTGQEARDGVSPQAPTISADGRYVAFTSASANLAPGDDDRFNGDIFVRDMTLGLTQRVSLRPDGSEIVSADAFMPSMSANGRRIAFAVYDNILAGPTPHVPPNLTRGVYVRDLDTAQTILVSARPDGTASTLLISDFPMISANGRYVSFANWEDLDPAFPDSAEEAPLDGPFADIFVRDLQMSSTRRASLPFPGGPAEESGRVSSISGDGRFVAYSNGPDMVVRDMIANTSTVIRAPDGSAPNHYMLTLGQDGRFAYAELFDDLIVPSDTNGTIDAFLFALPPPAGADLSLTLTASTMQLAPGADVTFTVSVANGGGQNATGVTVAVPLPAGVTHVSDTGGGALAGGTWTIGALASGATATVQIVGRPTALPVTVVAQVMTAAPFDPDSIPGNDAPGEDDQASVRLEPAPTGIIVNDATGAVNANDGRCTLVEAIIAANTDAPSGSAIGECAGGTGPDTIHLRAVAPPYTFTTIHNTVNGYNALPPITSVITIDAAGQTIQRSFSTGTPPFRLFYVAADGVLTLDHAELRNGLASDPAGVSAAASIGGGVLNAGTLTIAGGRIAGNRARCDGGGIQSFGPLFVRDGAVIEQNTAECSGGGISNGRLVSAGTTLIPGGTLTIAGSAIVNNRASMLGGGIASAGPLAITATQVDTNRVAGGASFCGGGIYTNARLDLIASHVTGNEALNGGGLCATGQEVNVAGGTIGFNTAGNVGGGVVLGVFSSTPAATPREIALTGVSIGNNTAATHGGGVHFVATHPADRLIFDQATIQQNAVTVGGGGGLYLRGGTATLRNGTRVLNNAAAAAGGGILTDGTTAGCCDGPLAIEGGTIDGNTANGAFAAIGGGAGIAHFASSPASAMTLTGVTLSNNHAPGGGNGGGIFNRGALRMTNGVLRGNTAQSGGALSNGTSLAQGGPATLTGTTIENNVATRLGGGIFAANPASGPATSTTIEGGTIRNNRADNQGGGLFLRSNAIVNLSRTRVSGNVAAFDGGGTFNEGPLHVTEVTFADNAADNGGAIFATGRTTIARTTITANTARIGAGLRVGGDTTDIINSTISGNFATGDGGGALDVLGTFTGPDVSGRVNLLRTTIVNNIGSPGGINNGGYVQILQTILASNRRVNGAFAECAFAAGAPVGTIYWFGGNIVGQDPACAISGPTGDQRIIAPATVFSTLLGPLADNGGSTLTHAPLRGSLAIDGVADPGAFPCTTDQRGLPSPVDGDGDGAASCDVGAFEQQEIVTPPTPVLTQLSPAIGIVGTFPSSITVTGTGFTASSVATWNGSPRVTFAVSPTMLRVELMPADGAIAADIATALIQVSHPLTPASNALAFTIASPRVSSARSLAVAPGTAGSVSTTAAGGVSAALTNNTVGSPVATVTVATYAVNPASGTIFGAGGFFDLQVIGADPSDSVAASFYYPSTLMAAAEATLQLRYWTGSAWAPVLGSGGAPPVKNTTNDLDGVPSGGRFSVTFDSTSTPAITALGGTIFALATGEVVQPRITGSGYNSPESPAYRATFSIAANGVSSPPGAVRYSYARSRMHFVSTTIGAFGVDGSTVTIEGAGTVNNVAGYTFMAIASAASPNTFALEIRRGDGTLHYSAPALALAGGQFTITP